MASRKKLKLSTEDSEKTENMFVKVGKISGFFKKQREGWRLELQVNRLPASQMTAP